MRSPTKNEQELLKQIEQLEQRIKSLEEAYPDGKLLGEVALLKHENEKIKKAFNQLRTYVKRRK